ncbi:MAG: TonB-dependent receptor [Opitutaceae bacterium]|jgi:vitamin B12 transporter|nr:TonB-dependent receptor [Opitutaceae bacterium]
MNQTSLSSVTRSFLKNAVRLFIGSAFALTSLAQTAVTQLETVVTTATRTPVSIAQLGSAVDLISAADLQRRQISTLAGALDTIPGTPNFSSGAAGAVTSVFMRGSNSNQTLFLVDGIRLNDPNADYFNFLGGACVSSCDSLEVSHGPQSTLYGGEAMGGVVALSVQPGNGEPSGRVFLEAGSFGTVQGTIDAQGQRDATSYSVSLSGGHTDNHRSHNEFDSLNFVGRLDQQVSETLAIGATLRGFRGEYESPGDRFTNDPDNLEEETNWIATAFAEFTPSEDLSGRITVGGQLREFVSTNPGAFGTQVTNIDNERAILDAQFSYRGWDRHRVTAGVTAEANSTTNDGFGDIDEDQSLFAIFVQDEITLNENLWVTAGLRSDDHDTFGRATTGRGTLAWQVVPDQIKLRGSYGTAFRSPSFLDLYGTSAFYQGNPDLEAEEGDGWDVGVDTYFADGRGSASLTYFDTSYDNLIIFDFGVFPGTTANVENARTYGIETSSSWVIGTGTEVRANYTYLEAENESKGIRLLRRPRHSGSLDVWHDFGEFDFGFGLGFVADRKDVHASTFGTIDGEDYLVARFYGTWQVSSDFKIRARVENAFDKTYEPVHGFPQPGIGAFVGIEWSF